ncbi:MAG: flagellar basal body L-ring protein FlgH [Lautropia sp.]
MVWSASFDLRHAAARVALERAALALAVLALAACSTVAPPNVDIEMPAASRNAAIHSVPPPQANGAIFQAGAHRGMFEDRRARLLGDTLTIQIEEKLTAKQSSTSSVDRSGSADASIRALPFTSARSLGKLGIGGSSSNAFEGKGATGSDNQFAGTITVTVVEVLPNGNLVVAGEKQVGINQNLESLRFAGVVNPATIRPNNIVSSTQVADARMQVRGRGDIDKAQTTGWLTRFFLSFLPI